MAIGLIGRKSGMTRLFVDGVVVPVTVIEIQRNAVTQIKTVETDGYNAVQVAFSEQKPQRVTKPLRGVFEKAGISPAKKLREFRVNSSKDLENYATGQVITVEEFANVAKVDVVSTSKGKGFAGTIKRHNFSAQRATHGNSLSHRVAGSTGQNQTPGKVFKGKKMAGQLGNVRTTVRNLKVVKVDTENQLLLIKGSVPGATNGVVIIKPVANNKEEG